MTDTGRPYVQHPPWCSSEHCDADQGHADVRHSSAPVRWAVADGAAEIEMARYRSDELDPSGQIIHQEHGVHVGMRHHELLAHPDGTPLYVEVLLTGEDITRLEGEFARLRRLTQG